MPNLGSDPHLRLALGTAQFGQHYGIANQHGQVSLSEAKTILAYASACGIDTLDTAMAYGHSELHLGQIGVHHWKVVSKLPAMPEGCSDIVQWVADSVEESLQRLKIKSLYGLLLHRPLQLLERGGDRLYAALQRLKREGVVHKIGISASAPSDLDALCSRFQIDLVQAPFNIVDRRLIDSGWLSRLAEQGIELHTRSVFLQGLLLMKPGDRPQKFARWSMLWSKLDEWFEHAGVTPVQACLRYALSFSQIGKVIVGVDNLSQLEEILHAAKRPDLQISDELNSEDLDLLNPANWATLA